MSAPEESAPSPSRVFETHSAVVVLHGDRAYKWKKAVDLGFVDYVERDARREACWRELELNRRFAPDVYLDVATLAGSDGRALEAVLVMRRLPEDRRLSRLSRAGEDVGDCLGEVAATIARVHADTRTDRAVSYASADALRANWEDNLVPLRRHAAALGDVERTAELAGEYLAGRAPLFAERAPLACDGHGDLLADDIFCLHDGPRVIDCLDFDERYRLGDPLLDAAFLAMDLQAAGRPDLGQDFLHRYEDASGTTTPASLLDHYIAYRASVRAKVACLRAEQGVEEALDDAVRLHRLCVERLEAGRVGLVLVGGLPGTGKSTTARGLAEALGCTLLSSDTLRKEAAGVTADDPLDDEHYTPEARTAVYRALLERAADRLARGETVVLDASWADPAWRQLAAGHARDAHAQLVPLRCDAPAEVARKRLRERAGRRGEASDADAAVLDRLAATTPPWPDAERIDTTRADAVARAVDVVRRRRRS